MKRAPISSMFLVLMTLSFFQLMATQGLQPAELQQQSYARVQYANNNQTRRFNIQRDPTIQYVTFDELYNKMNKYNQEKSNDNKFAALESTKSTSTTSPTSNDHELTNQLDSAAVNNANRRWEDVPDLTNGWIVETTTVTMTPKTPSSATSTVTATSETPLNIVNDINKAADHMYAYSSAYQNADKNEFDRVEGPSTKSPESSPTTTVKPTMVDGSAGEYAHAVGGDEEVIHGSLELKTTTVQPIVMETSWNDKKPTKGQRPVVIFKKRIEDESNENQETSGKVINTKPSQQQFSAQQVNNANDQSSWRPFVGPSVPQVVNPAIVKNRPLVTSSPQPTIFSVSTADTLFYDETKNKIIFPPNNNNSGPSIIPVGIIVNDNSNSGVRRHPLVPIPSSSQRPEIGGSQQQVLVLPNLVENEVKTAPSQQNFNQQPLRFPLNQQFIGQFGANPHPINDLQRPLPPPLNDLQRPLPPPHNDQQRPLPPPPIFGQRNPPMPQNQFNQQRPPFQPNGLQRPDGPPFQPNGLQRPDGPPFQPNGLQRPDGPPLPPHRFNDDERFITGFPGPREPHRVPSGPVGLPPQLVPHFNGRPQQGGDSITIPRPRPTGVIGTSIDNPLPGPPIPLPGIPSGPVVISNSNHQSTQDRNGPPTNGGGPMFRPNFQVPDRSDAEMQHQENLIHPQDVQFGGQMNPNNLPPNFRPQNFPMPPRGLPPFPQQPPQPTSSPSLIKSLFSKLFNPFARSLEDEVPMIDSDTLSNWTLTHPRVSGLGLNLTDEIIVFNNQTTVLAIDFSTENTTTTDPINSNKTDSSSVTVQSTSTITTPLNNSTLI